MPIWKPHPGPQEFALRQTTFEILYGGARGGGKTDAGLVWLTDYLHHPRFRGLVIRKNADDLSDWIDRAYRMFSGFGVKIAYRPAILTFPSGAVIKTGHLKDDQAYTKYQGHEYHRALIEEATQIPDEKRYLDLISSCRSTIPELKPQIFLTANPGGVGHGWVKARFVDPAPPRTRYADPNTGLTRIYIPATMDDNPTLMENDPNYVKVIDAMKEINYDRWKAWRLGDWDSFAGQFFREFKRSMHVIRAASVSPAQRKIGGMDWGYTAPHSFEAKVLLPQNLDGVEFNRIITYREIYGTELFPEQLAQRIMQAVNLDEFLYIMCDPAMFHKKEDGSASIMDQMKTVIPSKWHHLFRMANNDRIGGWAMMHKWLSLAPDGLPYWLIMDNCINLIRTLPMMVFDEDKVEDIDTTLEDHALDAVRYCQMHTKWIDASAASVKRPQPVTYKKYRDERLIDLDAFAKPERGRDWKSI